MIIDKLENISKYKIVSKNILDFLMSVSPEIKTGHYQIDNFSYANIDVYETKLHENCKFEAHKKYIDIQMLLSGIEELDYTSIDGLKISQGYSEQKDIMFFENPDRVIDKVILQPEKFALIYPHEAHRPQMAFGGFSEKVKKVVVKIEI